jgi:hypothetical protein
MLYEGMLEKIPALFHSRRGFRWVHWDAPLSA